MVCEDVKVLRDEFFEYLERCGISQNKASQVMGISSGMLSAYKSGTYKGNTTELENKIQAWLEREKNRKSKMQMPFCELSTTNKIFRVIQTAHEESDIAVIVGHAGVGKTTAIKAYCDKYDTAFLIEVDTTFTKTVLIRELARAINIDVKGNVAELTQRIIRKLKSMDAVLIFDEADYLAENQLELIRRICHDKSECGVVLAGLPRLEYKIKGNYKDHEQLASRAGFLLHVDKLTKNDAKILIKSVWDLSNDDIIAEFFRAAGGSIRSLNKLMKLVWKIMGANQATEPALEYIKEAASLLMR